MHRDRSAQPGDHDLTPPAADRCPACGASPNLRCCEFGRDLDAWASTVCDPAEIALDPRADWAMEVTERRRADTVAA